MINEVNNYIDDISVRDLVYWIDKENNPEKRKLFELIKAEKLCRIKTSMLEVLKVVEEEYIQSIFGDQHDFISYSKNIRIALEQKVIHRTRALVELESEYRQLVANAIIQTSIKGTIYFGFLNRNKKYNEDVLVDTTGLVGGHVNKYDCNLYQGMIREVNEELINLSFEEASEIRPLGFIREVNKSIGLHHLCMLYLIRITDYENIKSAEEKEDLIWIDMENVKKEVAKDVLDSRFDSWTYMAMKNYLEECE